MLRRESHYRWQWRLRSSPDALWPLVADTNRFNRDAGVPPLEQGAVGRGGRRLLGLSKLGIPVEWEEEPFEWIEPFRFAVIRRYSRGPLAEMRVAVELRPEGEGTTLVYEVWARPGNVLGLVAIPIEIGRSSRKRFERTFRRYDDPDARAQTTRNVPRLVPAARRRLVAGREALLANGVSEGLVDRLLRLLECSDGLTVARLRPYALADAWGADRRRVLELFLHATRAGLVELRWDLLCPLCRGAQERATTLGEIQRDLHCDSCAIDFKVDFEHSVELSFRPARAIREVVEREFCVGGPQVTPHVVAQQLLEPGGERTLEPLLPSGGYRVRAREVAGGQRLFVSPTGSRKVTLRLDEGGWPSEELSVAENPALRLLNATGGEQLVVLERVAWSDQVVTAAEVTALQVFRDLFAGEALRPGEPISVGTLTILFTDLRDSTRFYREVGDAPAFGSVMDHLDVLRDAVTETDGALVKVMGDAIMAVFTRPLAAVRAALAVQRSLKAPADAKHPLLLKAGIHTGPCIAVTQNERLDYFGSTVNLAARLVGLSSGSEVIVSSSVVEDPEVAELLASQRSGLEARSLEATLKGFEDERFEVWSLAGSEAAVPEPASAALAAE
jgi:class 3 adenylate cyclase